MYSQISDDGLECHRGDVGNEISWYLDANVTALIFFMQMF